MTQTAQAFTAAERRAYIGASEVAAIMGLDKWRTPLQVFQEKTGLTEPFAGNKHTERGNRLETIAAELFTELTGKKLLRKTSGLVHPAYPFIVGHIDRIIIGEKKLAEIKCPSIAAFRKYQREGLPESMVIQMQIYLGLTGYTSGTWLIFCADAWDLASFDIEFDEMLYTTATRWAVEFWNEHILTGIAPAEGDDAATVEIEKTGTVTFRDDEPFRAKASALREAIELKRDAESLFEMAKKDVIDAVEGECGIYEGAGVRIHYTEQAGRKSFDKKALAKAHPEIDLSSFEKTGSSFKNFRPYLLNTGE